MHGKNGVESQINGLPHGYKQTSLPTTGLLYQFLGTVQSIDAEFKLVTYINISAFDRTYESIEARYASLDTFCEQYTARFPLSSVYSNCDWLKASTQTLFHEIDQIRQGILQALQIEPANNRRKRGLINAIGRLAKVLFGTCSDEDANFIYSKITEMDQRLSRTIHLVKEQTRVVHAFISDVNSTLDLQQKVQEQSEMAMKRLHHILKNMNDENQGLIVRELISEQAIAINLLLTQHSFEVQRLSDVVNSAIHGELHPNLMSHQQYVLQLKEIQLKLPLGLGLPFTLEQFRIAILAQITEVSVVYLDNILMFIQRIPLINTDEYQAYKVVPFPTYLKNNIYSLIDSTSYILGLSKNREHYIMLSESQFQNCKRKTNFQYFCVQGQNIYSTENEICEIRPLIGQTLDLSLCKIKYVKITKSMFVRLINVNTWIYIVFNESVRIKCKNEDPLDFILNGIGQITISPQCQMFAKHIALTPSQTFSSNISVQLYSPLETPPETHFALSDVAQALLDEYTFPNNQRHVVLEDIASHAKSLEEIETELSRVEHPMSTSKRENIFYVLCLTVLITIIVTAGCLLYFSFRLKSLRPKMYQPGEVIAETPI